MFQEYYHGIQLVCDIWLSAVNWCINYFLGICWFPKPECLLLCLKWSLLLHCIHFLQKPLGLLSLLDEESNFPNATDLTFANKLKQHLSCNPCFKAERGRTFVIHHYAGEVSYAFCRGGLIFFPHLFEPFKSVSQLWQLVLLLIANIIDEIKACNFSREFMVPLSFLFCVHVC